MPHDAFHRPLRVGDVVLIPARVRHVSQVEGYCNLSVETLATMPPNHEAPSHFGGLNSAMTLRANTGDLIAYREVAQGRARFLVPADTPGLQEEEKETT